jgi:tetratricopeptide (TPR) repeat protein
MRLVFVVTAGLGLCLLLPARAPGGLYNFAEPADKFGTFEEFSEALVQVRQINSTEILTPSRQRYLLMADLAERDIPAEMDDLDRINLSGYLLRLRDPKDARKNNRRYLQAKKILESVVRRDPKNFLAHSNLATAYWKLDQLQRAETTLSVALDNWPRRWQDLPKERRTLLEKKLHWEEPQFQQYREVETYQRKLLLLRLRDAQKRPPPQDPDPLFDTREEKVHFVGPSGKYEAGKLAADEKSKLPQNALAIVEQLVLWEPDDPRLRWLAAELFNAEGNAKGALKLFEYLIDVDKIVSPELKEHRAVLVRETPASPRPALDFTEPAAKVEAKDGATSPWPTNPWQLLGVGFGAGALVALLGVWQVREIRRRRP